MHTENPAPTIQVVARRAVTTIIDGDKVTVLDHDGKERPAVPAPAEPDPPAAGAHEEKE